MKNILILGSEGYLGSVLVPFLLRKNLKITGIDKCFFGRKNKHKKNFRFIKGDYKNIKDNFLTKFDFIVDLIISLYFSILIIVSSKTPSSLLLFK